MEEQVLSIQQMQELIDMGVDVSKASMCWLGCADKNGVYLYNSTFKDIFENHKETIPSVLTPTFTFQDILEMFSQGSLQGSLHFNKNKFIVFVADNQFNVINEEDSVSPIEAAFKMLKWCKENNYI